MLFARGVWSIFGIKKSSQGDFEATIASDKLAAISQAVVLTKTKLDGIPSFGINPYEFPRLDEQDGYAFTNDHLKLDDGVYGFWLAVNASEDVTDPKSKQEALAYKDANRPFRFLSKDEKKVIEANVTASAVLSRKQFPVLVDFASETVYAASGNVEEVSMVRSVIELLGGEDFSLAWQFDTPEWTRKFLEVVVEKNKFNDEMSARADELMRFRPEEVEKLDDKMTESIISNYFSMSELDTGVWAGLSAPTRIHINSTYDPISVSTASTAFAVIRDFKNTEVAAAGVTFQSLDTRFNKKGDEKPYRTDLFTIDVNDNVNLTDAGAALLRGFDIPTFKRNMKKVLKAQVSVPIGHYWASWLSDMKTAVNTFTDNVTETLKIDKKKYGLKPYAGELIEEEPSTLNVQAAPQF